MQLSDRCLQDTIRILRRKHGNPETQGDSEDDVEYLNAIRGLEELIAARKVIEAARELPRDFMQAVYSAYPPAEDLPRQQVAFDAAVEAYDKETNG